MVKVNIPVEFPQIKRPGFQKLRLHLIVFILFFSSIQLFCKEPLEIKFEVTKKVYYTAEKNDLFVFIKNTSNRVIEQPLYIVLKMFMENGKELVPRSTLNEKSVNKKNFCPVRVGKVISS